MKTRLITIKRTYIKSVPDGKGNVKQERVSDYFPCKVNAGIPLDHKMCR